MPTYTIIGATGKTGGALLKLLLERPDSHINAYVRSKQKLVENWPGTDENKKVSISTGSLDDIPSLASAVAPGVDAVFMVVGQNESYPGMRIAQDSSQALIAALCYARSQSPDVKLPKLLFLSSATINPRISANAPWLVHEIVYTALSYAYEDLELAERYLRMHESWVEAIFVQPGALVEDEQKGHAVGLDVLSDFVSYYDLAAGIIEIAESGKYAWQGVGVRATSRDVRFEPNAPKQMIRGLIWHFFPVLYRISKFLRLPV